MFMLYLFSNNSIYNSFSPVYCCFVNKHSECCYHITSVQMETTAFTFLFLHWIHSHLFPPDIWSICGWPSHIILKLSVSVNFRLLMWVFMGIQINDYALYILYLTNTVWILFVFKANFVFWFLLWTSPSFSTVIYILFADRSHGRFNMLN